MIWVNMGDKNVYCKAVRDCEDLDEDKVCGEVIIGKMVKMNYLK